MPSEDDVFWRRPSERLPDTATAVTRYDDIRNRIFGARDEQLDSPREECEKREDEGEGKGDEHGTDSDVRSMRKAWADLKRSVIS